MTTLEDVIEEFNETVKAAFSLASTSPNYRDVRAGRLDWRGLIAKWQASSPGGLQPPYVVTFIGQLYPAPDWSALDDHRYFMPVEVYYIDLAATAIEAIDTKIQSLHDALDEDAIFTTFQIVEEGTINNTSANPANAAFLESATPLIAGMWSGQLLVSK